LPNLSGRYFVTMIFTKLGTTGPKVRFLCSTSFSSYQNEDPIFLPRKMHQNINPQNHCTRAVHSVFTAVCRAAWYNVYCLVLVCIKITQIFGNFWHTQNLYILDKNNVRSKIGIFWKIGFLTKISMKLSWTYNLIFYQKVRFFTKFRLLRVVIQCLLLGTCCLGHENYDLWLKFNLIIINNYNYEISIFDEHFNFEDTIRFFAIK